MVSPSMFCFRCVLYNGEVQIGGVTTWLKLISTILGLISSCFVRDPRAKSTMHVRLLSYAVLKIHGGQAIEFSVKV